MYRDVLRSHWNVWNEWIKIFLDSLRFISVHCVSFFCCVGIHGFALNWVEFRINSNSVWRIRVRRQNRPAHRVYFVLCMRCARGLHVFVFTTISECIVLCKCGSDWYRCAGKGELSFCTCEMQAEVVGLCGEIANSCASFRYDYYYCYRPTFPITKPTTKLNIIPSHECFVLDHISTLYSYCIAVAPQPNAIIL